MKYIYFISFTGTKKLSVIQNGKNNTIPVQGAFIFDTKTKITTAIHLQLLANQIMDAHKLQNVQILNISFLHEIPDMDVLQ
jgi:hypothetical protein